MSVKYPCLSCKNTFFWKILEDWNSHCWVNSYTSDGKIILYILLLVKLLKSLIYTFIVYWLVKPKVSHGLSIFAQLRFKNHQNYALVKFSWISKKYHMFPATAHLLLAKHAISCHEHLAIPLSQGGSERCWKRGGILNGRWPDLVGALEHGFYDFPYIGNSNPNWLIFFRGAETTNQL
jgi:hypothetical protein